MKLKSERKYNTEVNKKASKSNSVINRLRNAPLTIKMLLHLLTLSAVFLSGLMYVPAYWIIYLSSNTLVMRNINLVNNKPHTVPLSRTLKTLTLYDMYSYQQCWIYLYVGCRKLFYDRALPVSVVTLYEGWELYTWHSSSGRHIKWCLA